MKFIIAPVYTVYERSVHPHYPQGFPQVLGVKPPVRRGFPRLFSPSAGELLYIFHRPKFFFVISLRKSVCFKINLRRRLAHFCQYRRFLPSFPQQQIPWTQKIYCKISCIFYKCIAFSGIRFIHFVRTHSSRLRSAHQSASAAKNAAAHALRKHAQRRKGIQVQRSRFPAHKAVKGGGTDHSGIVCTQGHRR